MLEITRQYLNGSDETLRADTIIMERMGEPIARAAGEHTFRRVLRTQWFYGPTSRTVAAIELVGNFSSVETSSGNFLYAEWVSPAAICDMSDLPKLSDTI
jgi:hypothetical protein